MAKRGRLFTPLFVGAIWLTGAPQAHADPITFHFQGTVSEVFDSGFLDGSVTEGTLFHGLYTFDSAATNTSANPREGQYLFEIPPSGLRVEVGNYAFETDPTSQLLLSIRVRNEFLQPGNDSYVVISPLNESTGPAIDPLVQIINVHWFLFTLTSNPLLSTDLPLVPPPLEPWFINSFSIEGDFPGGSPLPLFTIRGEVDTIVPEPAHLGLLGLVVVALLRFRRRGR